MPRRFVRLLVAAAALLPGPAGAELLLPPGFTARVYISGEGFEPGAVRGMRGIPTTSTLAFDASGALYLARTGRRYFGGEVEDLPALYRIPAGGARLVPGTERDFLFGPPLPNPQVAAIRAGREVLVTTYDRERRIGVLYRIVEGRVDFVAGGTPPPGAPPLFRQPEGAAVDRAGNLYVADRQQGIVVRLGPDGAVLGPRYLDLARPRLLAVDAAGHLWVGADGTAEAPWQRGAGEIWRVAPDGARRLMVRGTVPAGMGLSPAGHLFVADRHEARIFAVTAEGDRVPFARFTEGDAPRSLAFAPATPATREAGLAGDLFVVIIRRGAWPLNEVIRIAGPFDEYVGQHR
jgi:hypothetical protein